MGMQFIASDDFNGEPVWSHFYVITIHAQSFTYHYKFPITIFNCFVINIYKGITRASNH